MKVEALFGLSVLVSFLAFRRRLEAEAIALRKILSTSSVRRRNCSSMKAITCWTATAVTQAIMKLRFALPLPATAPSHRPSAHYRAGSSRRAVIAPFVGEALLQPKY